MKGILGFGRQQVKDVAQGRLQLIIISHEPASLTESLGLGRCGESPYRQKAWPPALPLGPEPPPFRAWANPWPSQPKSESPLRGVSVNENPPGIRFPHEPLRKSSPLTDPTSLLAPLFLPVQSRIPHPPPTLAVSAQDKQVRPLTPQSLSLKGTGRLFNVSSPVVLVCEESEMRKGSRCAYKA